MSHVKRSIFLWLLAGAFLLSLSSLSASGDLSGSFRQVTRSRERISLNGVWDFQPASGGSEAPAEEAWYSLKVPGTWGIYESHGGQFLVTSGEGVPVTTWQGDDIQKAPAGWYRRQIKWEKGWQRKRLLLTFDGVNPRGRVWINESEAGKILPFEGSELDVTSLLEPDRVNILTVFVDGTGCAPAGKIGYGLVSDVWLDVIPYVGHIGDVFSECDSRKKSCTFAVSVEGIHSPRLYPTIEVECPLTRKDIVRAQAPLMMPRMTARVVLNITGAELWSFENPRLYNITVRLNIGGILLDEKVVRTGFRDFRISGSDFILNDTKVHLRFESGWHDTTYRNVFDEGYIRSFFAVLKDLGYNGVSLHGWWEDYPFKSPAIRIADEMGLLTVMRLPELGCDAADILADSGGCAQSLGRIKRRLSRYSMNPSLVMWRQVAPGRIPGTWLNPRQLDMLSADRQEDSQNRRSAALKLQEEISEMDPGRLVFLGHGNMGDFYSCNPYLIFTVPLQERAEWPALWADRKHAPLVAEEFTTVLPLALVNEDDWEKRSHGLISAEEQEVLTVEHAARYLGDEAYRLTRDGYPDFAAREYKHLYGRIDAAEEWNGVELALQNKAYMKLCALYARDTLRAWRTYGLSGLWLFGCADVTSYQNVICHLGSRRVVRQYPDLSLPGAKLDIVKMPAFDARTPVYDVLQKEYGPVSAYIGGGKKKANKDHAYYVKEHIQKQVVFINDHLAPVSADGICRLLDANGKTLNRCRVRLQAQAGDVVSVPIAFVAPDGRSRQQLFLKLELETSLKESLVDWLPVEIFPQPTSREFGATCVVYDELGVTERMLDSSGMKYVRLDEDVDLREYDVLIVGRDSFTRRLRRLLFEKGFHDVLLTHGLRVLVLEQTDRSAMGEWLEERNSRLVFPRLPEHRSLEDLQLVDLRYWRGASHMVEPWYEQVRKGRFYKGSNTNTVATFLLEKPVTGAFRPIVDCGFDQGKVAVMETYVGTGTVVYSQLDAVERYGQDPVATEYLDNMLSYLGSVKPRSIRPTAYIGDDDWLSELSSAGVDVEAFAEETSAAEVVIIGPGVTDDTVLALADQGATLLCLAPRTAQQVTRRIFGEQAIKSVKTFRVSLSPSASEYTKGVSEGDLFLKDNHELFLAVNEGRQDAVLSRVHGMGKILLCLLEPGMISNRRAKAKVRRLQSLILTNAGVPFRPLNTFAAVPCEDPAQTCLVSSENTSEAVLPVIEEQASLPSGVSVSVDRETGDEDTLSLRVDFLGEDTNFHHAYAEYDVCGDVSYRLDLSIKMAPEAGMDGGLNRVCVQVETFRVDGERIGRTIFPGVFPWLGGTRDWTRFSETIITDPEAVKLRVIMRRIEGGGPVKGTVWYDRVILKKRFSFPAVHLFARPEAVSDYDPNEWHQW